VVNFSRAKNSTIMQVRIKVTIRPENALWVGIFERVEAGKITAARVIFGKEPTDPELYEWLLSHFDELNFSAPQDFKLTIKRKSPKRVQREVRKEMEKAASTSRKASLAQEALRLELEKNKKLKKSQSKEEKIALTERRFLEKQEKKKQKKRGH